MPTVTVPLFPLTGVLLLPGNFLPLNIFEPRYRNLVRDALESDRSFGLVQPVLPGPDNWGLAVSDDDPALYPVGCVGRIERCEAQPDGRFLLLLAGRRRFRILEEIEGRAGYRRARADLDEFSSDLTEPELELEVGHLLAAVREFATVHQIEIDVDLLAALPGPRVLNALCAALPFAPAERQLLLEAPSLEIRMTQLLALMGFGLDASVDAVGPPTVH